MDPAVLAALASARVGAKTPDGWLLRRLERVDLMAATYGAEDEAGGTATVRVLSPPLAKRPDAMLSFGATARLTSEIDHEDAVRLLAVGTLAEGEPYVVLAPHPGETVAELVARRPGRVPPGEALRLVCEALAVLDVAHAAGILHGALGPDQLVVTDCGSVKILGFGAGPLLAEARRALEVEPTPTQAAFTAPELREDPSARPSVAMDLWGVGAVLFHLLTGELPRVGEAAAGPLLGEQRTTLGGGAEGNGAPAALEALVARGLARAPEARFPSAASFRGAVARVMAMPDVLALRPLRGSTPPRSAPPPPREHPGPTAVTEPRQTVTGLGQVAPPARAAASPPSGPRPDPRAESGPPAPAVGGASLDDAGSELEATSLPQALGLAWSERALGEFAAGQEGLQDLLAICRETPGAAVEAAVLPWGLEDEEGNAWEAQGVLLRGIHALYAGGLRRIVLGAAVDDVALEALVDLPLVAEGIDDAARYLGELGNRLGGALEVVRPRLASEREDAATMAERRELIALVRFDTGAQLEDCWRAAGRWRATESPGAWRAAVAADLSPWLDELPWSRDPRRRATLCQKLAEDIAAEQGWEALLESTNAPVGIPTEAARRASPTTRARALRALASLVTGEQGGIAVERESAVVALVEALAQCGAEGDETLAFRLDGTVPLLNDEPLCDTRDAHAGARALAERLRELGIGELSLAVTLTVRAARELAARAASGAGALREGAVAGVSVVPPRSGEGRASGSEPPNRLLYRHVGALVRLRRSLAELPAAAAESFAVWRALADELAGEPPESYCPALALTLAGSQRGRAPRALQAACLVAAAARDAGATPAAVARVTLAGLILAAGRARSPAPAASETTAAIATLAAAATPVDAEGRAACVIAARAADILLGGSAPAARRGSGKPISRPPASRSSTASAELVVAAVELLDAIGPTESEAAGRTPADALRWLATEGNRAHNAVGALVGALGGLPVGTVVELDDGAWAVVAAPPAHPHDLDRPTVRIMTDGSGRALEPPKTRDLAASGGRPERVARLVPAACCRFNAARAVAD